MLSVRFGSNTVWELPAASNISMCAAPEGVLAGFPEALHAALMEPLEFPSLNQAVVPGDKLVLAVDPYLPCLPQTVTTIADWFCAQGTDPTNMRIVLGSDGLPVVNDLQSCLHDKLRTDIAIEVHDPDDQSQLAYVAANEASDPIYINRSMVDADVVIPVSCARPASALDYLGVYSLFPLFSDRATRGSFYSLPRLQEAAENANLRSWAEQAAWWLGLLAGIQIVPAGANQVAAVLAGQLQPLESASQQAMAESWTRHVAPSELVIALLDGSDAQHTWLGFARALYAATRCTKAGGSIVVCTQLDQPIGAGLRRLQQQQKSAESIAKQLAKDTHDDAIAAATMLEATASHHVYLVSKLRADAAESIGLGFIGDAAELGRLMQQHASCTILASAQHCWLAE